MEGYTGEDGLVYFTVPGGVYRVTVSKLGYVTETFRVEVYSNIQAELELLEIQLKKPFLTPIAFVGVGLALAVVSAAEKP